MQDAHATRRTLAFGHERLARRRLQPVPAIKAGLAAGAIAFLLLQLAAIVIYDESPWRLVRAFAAMVRGPAVLVPDDEFDAAVALVGLTLFFAISTLYSLALSGLVSEAPRRWAPALGAAFGAALYFANFHGFTALFPWFAPYRTLDTLAAHVIFGIAAARGYSLFRRR